ncbi:MAG: hypothetical protein M1818_006734 [Claussenomyces sp. TS43310]|nr:MAG: hypothetical protein M1818_006734 [Claussenomyces sp. TS43310]
MQKVFRRAAMAEQQAARRLARRKDRYERQEQKTQRDHQMFVQRDVTKDIKEARKIRRENYDQGALAPKRDVGLRKDTYGTLSTLRIQGKDLTMAERLELNPLGGRYPNIVTGDRVVLLEGNDRGKIGKITSVDRRKQECTVEGLNMVEIEMPKWAIQKETSTRPIRTVEKPVLLTSIKLVFPLPDPATGIVRDVIVKKLVNGKVWHDRRTGRKRWSRFISGLDVLVPWPKVEPKERQDYDCDTLRIDVEAKTFVPTLLKAPMPGSVIDELRNKYSKFRTRHDEEYIAKKTAEEEEKEAKKRLARTMMTPLKEVNRRARKLRKAKGKGKLTREMMMRIGEVIARRRQPVLETSGLEKVAQAA